MHLVIYFLFYVKYPTKGTTSVSATLLRQTSYSWPQLFKTCRRILRIIDFIFVGELRGFENLEHDSEASENIRSEKKMISTTFAVVKYQRPKWSPWWDILPKIKKNTSRCTFESYYDDIDSGTKPAPHNQHRKH